MFARQFMIIILSIIAFLTECIKFILKLGELPVGELEFIAFVCEFLSGRFKLIFKFGDAATQFGNISGSILDVSLQLRYLVIQFNFLPFEICNHGRKTFDTRFILMAAEKKVV